jgi:hypothetical protein
VITARLTPARLMRYWSAAWTDANISACFTAMMFVGVRRDGSRVFDHVADKPSD